jgi:hypothetical protein
MFSPAGIRHKGGAMTPATSARLWPHSLLCSTIHLLSNDHATISGLTIILLPDSAPSASTLTIPRQQLR